MAAASETNPTTARLTPLADVLALIDREVKPVAPRGVALGEALDGVLAADVVSPALPTRAIALVDGWALAAETTFDASGLAPAPLPVVPARVEAGQAMPAGTDGIAPLDAVKVSNNRAEALAVIQSGDGVLPAGGDSDGKVPLRKAGETLRAVDLAAFAATKISEVSVRAPRLWLAARNDPIVAAASRLVGKDSESLGGDIAGNHDDMSSVLGRQGVDFIVATGGTGNGRNDVNVQTLARGGRLIVHGVGISPGESAAFGMAGARPVLLLPGRLDAALAVWVTLGRHIMRRLAGGAQETPGATLTLSRKIASTVGLAEVIPGRRTGDHVEPLAAKYLGFSALTRSDGYILVPAESEGYSAGTPVSLRPWP